ncbi:hypothetical protein [Comamonas granuli]|uniref:hypothetical protein n=1 Tax=Comamonas granuli TaxID=290309 RepID=UPI0012EB9E3F|nr:hypothetical protein [Comamonas granuli]
MKKNKSADVKVIAGDPYAYYLSIWDTEESLQERNRTMFITLQGILLTVALLYIESNKGMVIYFSLMAILLFTEWLPGSLARSKKIAFVKWLIIEHETNNYSTLKVFSAIDRLEKKCMHNNISLLTNESFRKNLYEARKIEFTVAGGFLFLWSALISFALSPNSESKMMGDWILSIFGIGTI